MVEIDIYFELRKTKRLKNSEVYRIPMHRKASFVLFGQSDAKPKPRTEHYRPQKDEHLKKGSKVASFRADYILS